METPDKFLYEYAVVRYVPDLAREEFVNIGLIMMCKRQKWLKGKIKLPIKKLLVIDPLVNIEKLERQASFFQNKDVPDKNLPVEEKYRWLTAVKSAVLQTSPSHPAIIPDAHNSGLRPQEALDIEFERLFGILVE